MAAKKKAAPKKKKAAPKKRTARKTAAYREPKPVNPTGRPSSYTPELVDEMCRRLSDGVSIYKMTRDDPNMPARASFNRWMLGIGVGDTSEEELTRFRGNYATARELYEQHTFEKLEAVNDEVIADPAYIGRARLWSDNVKWSLARMNRAKYGDKADLNIGGQGDESPVKTETILDVSRLTPEEQEQLRKLAHKTLNGDKT